jgi:hypothetical protein
MDTQPTFGPNELLAHIVGDTAEALSERAGESRHQQRVRAQAAAGTILTFLPRDAIEAMLAGHCVMFHELIVDSVLGAMRGEAAATRHATRCEIVTMDKAFGNNLARLERYRTRQEAVPMVAQPSDARAELDIADRVHRHQPATQAWKPAESGQEKPALPEAGSATPHITIPVTTAPRPATTTPRPSTTTALPTPGPGRLAPPHTMDEPRANSPAPAVQMTGLNRQARRAIGRQSARRGLPCAQAPAGTARPGVTPIRNGPTATLSAMPAG